MSNDDAPAMGRFHISQWRLACAIGGFASMMQGPHRHAANQALKLLNGLHPPIFGMYSTMKRPSLSQRLKAKNRNQMMLIGVTWYTEETWAQVKATAIDPECFEDSFEKWKAVAVAARREFQRSGVRAVECQIVPEEFFAWCSANNQENNATSRAEFVSAVLTAAANGGTLPA